MVVESAINVDYATQANNVATDPSNLDLSLMAGTIVTSQNWRIEVTQGTDIQPFEGVRLVEVDAIVAQVQNNPNSGGGGGGGFSGISSLMLMLVAFFRMRQYGKQS